MPRGGLWISLVVCVGMILPISTEIPSLFAPATLLRSRSQVQNIGEIGISAALREGRRGSSLVLRGGADDSEVDELSSYGDMRDVEEGDEAVAFKDATVQVTFPVGFGARCAASSESNRRPLWKGVCTHSLFLLRACAPASQALKPAARTPEQGEWDFFIKYGQLPATIAAQATAEVSSTGYLR